MTDPRDDRPAWELPEAAPPAGSPPAYGAPGSASYGKYGQGQADPAPPGPYSQPYSQLPDPTGPAPWGGRSSALSGLGTAVWLLAAAVTALYWVAAALAPEADRLFTEAGSLTSVSPAYNVVSAVSGLTTLAAWIVTSIWLMRARRNAVAVHPGGQRRSEVWTWIGWWVPIVSWWFPKQILDDTGATVANVTARPRRRTTPYWSAWVATNVVSGLQATGSLFAEPKDAVSPPLDVLIAVLATVALALWIPLVRGLSADSDAMTQGRR